MVWAPGWLLTVHKSISFQGLCMIAGLESFLKKDNICWFNKHILVGGFKPTPLKNISQNGSSPQVGVNIKNLWNHHLVHIALLTEKPNLISSNPRRPLSFRSQLPLGPTYGSKHLNSRVACCNAAVLKLIASKIKDFNPRKRSEANSNAFTFCNMAWKCPLATERKGMFWRWWVHCQWFCWGILDNNLL